MQSARRIGLHVLQHPAKVGDLVPNALCVAQIDSYPIGMLLSSFPSALSRRMFTKPIPMSQRRRMENTLATGTIAWDAMCPLGLGGSMIIHGPCERMLNTLREAPKVDRVVNTGDDYLEVFDAIADGTERVVKDKENILCILDMSRFPSYFNEAREATDIARGKLLSAQAELAEKRTFYSQVFERAVCHKDGGTLTLVCQLGNDVLIGDLREMQSLSDGHLSLSPEEIIDYRSSLSRFGMGSDTKGLRRHKMLQRVGSHIRTELCQFSDGIAGSSDAIGNHVTQIQGQVEAAMRQTSEPVPVEEQIVLLVGASTHLFPHAKVLEGGRTASLVEYFRTRHVELMEKLRHEGDKDLDLVARELDMGLRIFKAMQT